MTLEMLDQIEFNDGVRRDIWSLIFKTSVHVNGPMIMGPNGVAETLNRAQFFPFWIFSLVYLHGYIFAHRVCSTSENNHQGSNENCGMLISGKRLFTVILVGSLDPVPATISVSSESPGIFEGWLVSSSASENDHHSSGWAHVAHCSRVIHPDIWNISWCFEFEPTERGLVNIKAPNIVDSNSTSIATKGYEVGFVEYYGVSIPSSGSLPNHWNDHPLGHLLAVSQVE